jgi:hypothetical protein
MWKILMEDRRSLRLIEVVVVVVIVGLAVGR